MKTIIIDGVEYNLTPKVVFHKGDWVVCEITGSVYQIRNCIENLSNHKYGYDLTSGNYVGSDEVSHYHLWTIEDAKDGDVLVASDGSLFIFAKVKDNSAYYHFSLLKNGSKEISDGEHAWETAMYCHPATKEQRDLLFQKMKEAGYTFDFEKKELKKIKQKPAWGEEDGTVLNNLIYALANDRIGNDRDEYISWLKSLKERMKREWNYDLEMSL